MFKLSDMNKKLFGSIHHVIKFCFGINKEIKTSGKHVLIIFFSEKIHSIKFMQQ